MNLPPVPTPPELEGLDDNAIAMISWDLLDPEMGLVDAETVYPELYASFRAEASPVVEETTAPSAREEQVARGLERLAAAAAAARESFEAGRVEVCALLLDGSAIDAMAKAYVADESICNATLLEIRAVRGMGGHVDHLERQIKKRARSRPPPPRSPGPQGPGGVPSGPRRHTVTVGSRTDLSDLEALAALAAHPDIYWSEALGLVQADSLRGAIKPVNADALPPILNAVADFVQMRVKDGLPLTDSNGEVEWVQVQPPNRLARALAARVAFPGVREVQQVTHVPVVHPDGHVTAEPGYDEAMRLLYLPLEAPPDLVAKPTRADAVEAREELLDVVREFPLQTDADRSAWLALVLTLTCRATYEGATPAFVASANQARVGKTRLIQVAEYIAVGRVAAVMPWAKDRDGEENRKRIDSTIAAGRTLALFDNVRGPIGNEALEAALTTTRYELRMLGSNELRDVPQRTVFAISANGATYAGDMAGRVLPIRLHVSTANPEQRTFERADIFAWLQPRRRELLSAAITMVRAYLLAGRPLPRRTLPEWGSYEAWSEVIRGAIVWAGGPDPIGTRAGVRENDNSSGGHERFIALLAALFPNEMPWTVAQFADLLDAPALHPDSMIAPGWTLSEARGVLSEIGGWDRRDKQVDRFVFGRHVLPQHAERPNLEQMRITRALDPDGQPRITRNKAIVWVLCHRDREPGEEG